MTPLVSVVVPVYRVEAYLSGCMDRLLGQTYQNLEIILVDDGSPDCCGSLCDGYARRDPRVKVIHRENGGLSAARNSGLESASGQYVTFVDSDDRIAVNAIAHMVELAQKEQADIVKICLVRCYDGKIPEASMGGYTVRKGREVLRTIYDVPPQIISACGKLFRRELFHTVRFPEGRFFEDEFTTPKLYAVADTVVLSESVMYYYMQWDNASIMRSAFSEKKAADSLDATRQRIGFFRQLGMEDMVRRAKKDHYLKLLAVEQRVVPDLKASIVRERRRFARSNPVQILPVWLRRKLSDLKDLLSGQRKKP